MSKLKTFNAILMVTGTSVGTGILGLPIATSYAGFLPTMLAFVIAWIFMTIAALYILEVKMQVRGSSNLSSMIKMTLGKSGQIFSSVVIVALLYALLCTYMMAGSAWFNVLIKNYVDVDNTTLIMIFTMIFAIVLFFGEKFIYNINNILAVCLIIAFLITVGVNFLPNNYTFLEHADINAVFPSLPMLLTTFGFSIIIPAVTEYLEYDKKSVYHAIMWGGVISLIAYIVWEWITLGHIPLFGEEGLQHLLKTGDNGTGVILALAKSTQSHIVNISGRIFAIFAAVTSFMGVSVALIHFLADNLNIKSTSFNRVLLLLLVYIPPILITSLAPNAFVQVLGFAGIFVAVLLGLFPVLMVYHERNKVRRYSLTTIKKNIFLVISAIFFILVIIQEIKNLGL